MHWGRSCAVLLVIVAASASMAVIADDRHASCKSVDKIASLTHSARMAVTITSDDNSKWCHFHVALPPPYNKNVWIDRWFNGPVNAAVKVGSVEKLSEQQFATLVADIMSSGVPKDAADRFKSVAILVLQNSKIAYECANALVRKSVFKAQSADGAFSCTVAEFGEFAEFVATSKGAGLTSLVRLPRPV